MKKILIVAVLAAVVFTAYYFLKPQKNEWVCENDKWVRYGQPAGPAPLVGCGEPVGGMTVLPNPAEEFCNSKGYRVEYRQVDGQEVGYCQNGEKTKECEMNAFAGGQCQME